MELQLTTWLTAHWLEFKDFFNSVFFTAIAGSLAGAFAGAYGAQWIAERSKYREQLLKEMRITNAVIIVAFGICNSLLSLKKQHVKTLKEDFDIQKSALLNHQKRRQLGEIGNDAVFHFVADLQTLSIPPLSGDILQTQIFEKLSVVNRPLSLTTTLNQTIHSLNASLEKRNQLIEFYKSGDSEVTAPVYFGFPQGGKINQDYPSVIEAIYNQTDDGIFFSQLLCKDLVEHGNQIAEQFKKNFKKGAPTISEPDFSEAVKLNLMPTADKYNYWFTMFIKKIPPSKSKWINLAFLFQRIKQK